MSLALIPSAHQTFLFAIFTYFPTQPLFANANIMQTCKKKTLFSHFSVTFQVPVTFSRFSVTFQSLFSHFSVTFQSLFSHFLAYVSQCIMQSKAAA